MKILYLFHFKPWNNYDHYLNIDFAYILGCYPGIELQGYGLHLTEHQPNLAPLRYNPNILLADIYKNFQFDIIIANTKGRCFEYYNPHEGIDHGTWLPKDFAQWNKTPKIIFEEDYHYEANDNWYKIMGFDLILQRHYSQYFREEYIPMKFFPFSVDTSTFNPWRTEANCKNKIIPLSPQNKRQKHITFVGHNADAAYIYRQKAIKKLVESKLAIDFSSSESLQHRKIDGEYIKILRDYLAYISCGSIYEICAAKNFEIISSGGILFTNKFFGIDEILPDYCYVSYKEDLTDLIGKAKLIINEPEYCKEVVNNGREWINQHHTHEIRIEELKNIIRSLK